MFVAVVCGIANNRQHPRSCNIKSVSCQSNEKCETYLRLKEEDVKELMLEYMGWRHAAEQVGSRYYNRMEVFLQHLYRVLAVQIKLWS